MLVSNADGLTLPPIISTISPAGTGVPRLPLPIKISPPIELPPVTGSGAGGSGGMANPPSPPTVTSNPTANPFSLTNIYSWATPKWLRNHPYYAELISQSEAAAQELGASQNTTTPATNTVAPNSLLSGATSSGSDLASQLLAGASSGVPGAGDISSMVPAITSPATTTSSGPASSIAIIAIVAALGLIGFWFWKNHKKKQEAKHE